MPTVLRLNCLVLFDISFCFLVSTCGMPPLIPIDEAFVRENGYVPPPPPPLPHTDIGAVFSSSRHPMAPLPMCKLSPLAAQEFVVAEPPSVPIQLRLRSRHPMLQTPG